MVTGRTNVYKCPQDIAIYEKNRNLIIFFSKDSDIVKKGALRKVVLGKLNYKTLFLIKVHSISTFSVTQLLQSDKNAQKSVASYFFYGIRSSNIKQIVLLP